MTIKFAKWQGMAGMFCIAFDTWKKKPWRYLTIQFIIRKKDSRIWGREDIWYDGPHCSFGLGPLLLIAWSW